MRILGIDPGLRFTGYGCVELGARDGSITLVEAGIIRLKPRMPVAARLAELDADLADLLAHLEPDVVAVEKLYAHYKHPLTAIIMAHARGVVLLNIRRAGLDLVELAATAVKKSLTGNGHASKSQIQHGIRAQLSLPAIPEPPDVADALAIALCALRRAAR